MAKLPYLPLYTGDWLKDPALSLCTPATRGVWMDLLCAMHELERCGEIRGEAEPLARLARCSAGELVHAVNELQTTGAAIVTERQGTYYVRNRRMYSESLKRKSNAERQMRHREVCRNSESNGVKTEQSDIDIDLAFAEFWKEYPAGRKKSKAPAREAFEKAVRKVPVEKIIHAVKAYAASDEGRGKYVKMPSTWLNQECWDDDRGAWRDLDKPRPTQAATAGVWVPVSREQKEAERRSQIEKQRKAELGTPRYDVSPCRRPQPKAIPTATGLSSRT